MKMNRSLMINATVILIIVAVIATVYASVHRFKKPGQMDVIAAESMNMSSMTPPAGAALVDTSTVSRGAIGATVTYTGTIRAMNEQDISPRVTGRIVSLSAYPGDFIASGALLVQLDTAELDAKSDQARAEAGQAVSGANAAVLTEKLHHVAALHNAQAEETMAASAFAAAQAEVDTVTEGINEAQAAVTGAKSGDDYWTVELCREKKLADAGAVSIQEYQSELAQAQAAHAALAQAQSKLLQARSVARAARATATQAQSSIAAAQATKQMALADIAVGIQQSREAQQGATASLAAARQAEVVQGYAEIRSPSDAVVTDRLVSSGTLVQPGTVIMRIAEIDQVRVQANVSVGDLGGISPGTTVTIQAQGNVTHPVLSGRVTSVFPSADPKTRTDIVEAVVPNPNHRLLPGEYVSMQITKRTTNTHLLVPAESVVTVGGTSTIWIAEPQIGGGSGELAAHQVSVETGATDGNVTEVLTGDVKSGDRVIRLGISGLSEGAHVIRTKWDANGPIIVPRDDAPADTSKSSGSHANTDSSPGMKM
jgi:RND family efflux transporter MFP subunit